MRRATFLKTLVLASTVGLPRVAWALTGRVLSRFDVKDQSAAIDQYGWVTVQFAKPPVTTSPTGWKLITGDGPIGPMTVKPWGTAISLSTASYVRVGRYNINFTRKTGNDHVLPPEIPQVDVVEDKVTIYYIKYV
jgi:hypothetical protein